MSDLRPRGVEVEIGGQKHTLLFTINAIDRIQEKCNASLFDAVKYAAQAADGEMDHDTIQNFRTVVTILLNDEDDGDLTEKEVGRMLDLENYKKVAHAVLRAYGISLPDPDEEDDFEDDEDPKAGTGL